MQRTRIKEEGCRDFIDSLKRVLKPAASIQNPPQSGSLTSEELANRDISVEATVHKGDLSNIGITSEQNLHGGRGLLSSSD